MPTIETSLHAEYQKDTWHVREAMREIISNALDGQERNRYENLGQMSLEYSKRKKELVVSNRGITVPTKALLMGTSESREDNSCIGTFGEGLPMALLVMARKGLPVTIYNGDEKWTPSIEKSQTFSGEPVLVIKTRQMMKDRDGFQVHIGDLDEEEYAAVLGMFLSLDPNFDAEQTIKKSWGSDRVLLQPEYKGRIYNKGVFVLEREDLLFGYDVELKLNRDRHMVSDWTLQDRLGSLLAAVVEEDEQKLLGLLTPLLFGNSTSLEIRDTYSSLIHSDTAVAYMAAEFQARYGENALPVLNMEEAQAIEFFGHRGIVVNELLAKMVQKTLGSLESLKEGCKHDVEKIYSLGDLSEGEKVLFNGAQTLVQNAVTTWEPNVRIVDFKDPGLVGVYRSSDCLIDVARKILVDFEETLATLVHEVCHSVGGDGTHDHGEAQVKVLARIVRQQLAAKAVR